MNTEILEKAIEIEGLIRILDGGNPAPETYALLARKTRELAQYAASLEEKRECEARTATEPATIQPAQEPAPEAIQPIPEAAIEAEAATSRRMEQAEALETEAASEATAGDKKPYAVENEDTDDILLDLDDDDELQAESEPEPEPSQKEPRAPQTGGASNLKSCFSLNDRFLYARELFDGNMKMFDSTLKSLEGVSDFAAVEDYFYNELDWDRGNENVKTFMETLSAKFN